MHEKKKVSKKDISLNTNSQKPKEPVKDQKTLEDGLDFFFGIEKFLHEPIRLQIMLHLVHLGKIDMIFLKKTLALTWGNLSFHISKLEENGYITVEKQFVSKKPLTLIAATPEGILKFEDYRKALCKFLNP